jgi:hypothetical protein
VKTGADIGPLDLHPVAPATDEALDRKPIRAGLLAVGKVLVEDGDQRSDVRRLAIQIGIGEADAELIGEHPALTGKDEPDIRCTGVFGKPRVINPKPAVFPSGDPDSDSDLFVPDLDRRRNPRAYGGIGAGPGVDIESLVILIGPPGVDRAGDDARGTDGRRRCRAACCPGDEQADREKDKR